jgi:hypothetical protein
MIGITGIGSKRPLSQCANDQMSSGIKTRKSSFLNYPLGARNDADGVYGKWWAVSACVTTKML